MKLNQWFKMLPTMGTDTLKTAFKTLLLKVGVILLLIFLVVFTISNSFEYLSGRYECHLKWVDSDIQSKYTYRGGCLINVDGQWIPSSNYRVN